MWPSFATVESMICIHCSCVDDDDDDDDDDDSASARPLSMTAMQNLK
jgi:hypothetical protein